MPSDVALNKQTMISIGERLRKAREKKSLTIDQVQKQTLIHSTVLLSLEEGRCDETLSPIYVKSFLKKYSAYLGLDSNEILKEYSLVCPEEPKKELVNIDRQEIKSSSIFLPKLLQAVGVAIVLVAVIHLGGFLTSKIKRLFKRPHPTITITKEKEKRTAAVKDISKVSTAYAPRAQRAVKPQVKAPMELVLKTKQNVLVKAKRDGVVLFERVLLKGTVESLTAESKINLYIAKLEAVELTLDGKPLGPLGKGVAKDVEITRSGVRLR